MYVQREMSRLEEIEKGMIVGVMDDISKNLMNYEVHQPQPQPQPFYSHTVF
jgi:hypothetical protein